MANVWFVRREGSCWVAPGGRPALVRPVTALVSPLDLAPQRFMVNDHLVPRPDLPAEDLTSLRKVMVEITPEDLAGLEFTAFRVGFYESPFSPSEAVRRLGP